MFLEYLLLCLKPKKIRFHIVTQIFNLLGLKEKFQQHCQENTIIPIMEILRINLRAVSVQLSCKGWQTLVIPAR
jgi:hypothetical protein